ncbi:unnamed protein product, partial [marine sediment metagenome]
MVSLGELSYHYMIPYLIILNFVIFWCDMSREL